MTLAVIDVPTLLVALCGGGGIASVLTWWLTKRNTSGTVRTSEASAVFTAQAGVTEDVAAYAATLAAAVSQGLAELNAMREQVSNLFQEKLDALAREALKTEQLVVCERRSAEKDARIGELEAAAKMNPKVTPRKKPGTR